MVGQKELEVHGETAFSDDHQAVSPTTASRRDPSRPTSSDTMATNRGQRGYDLIGISRGELLTTQHHRFMPRPEAVTIALSA